MWQFSSDMAALCGVKVIILCLLQYLLLHCGANIYARPFNVTKFAIPFAFQAPDVYLEPETGADIADNDDEFANPDFTSRVETRSDKTAIDHSLSTQYSRLCHEKKTQVVLSSSEYIYMPDFYYHVECNRSAHKGGSLHECIEHYGHQCVQQIATIHVLRRRVDCGIWEPFPIPDVKAGCDCMLRKRAFGNKKAIK